ncbi:MAG TPA: hypothetical protein VM238_22850 [Phycisphaerae bacterium]|nr:hypothetical protein [Phycisphaerae bacterium]
MTEEREARIVQLSTGAVLGTLAGARRRVANLSLADLMALVACYECDVDHLHRHLWGVQRLYQVLVRADRKKRKQASQGAAAPES